MKIYVDWETGDYNSETETFKGELNARKPVLGCLIKEDAKKPKTFMNPKKMWKYIIELGIKEAKRKKTLAVYMHNAQFDTATFVDITDKHLTMFSNNPLIWNYNLSKKECEKHDIICKGEQKQIITFLDTMSIYPKMSLAKVAKMIGTEKIEYDLSKEQRGLKILEEYCANDAIIAREAIKKIRDKLLEENIQIKRLFTINQIGRNYLFNKWLNMPEDYIEPYFWNPRYGQTRRTFRKKEIHAAYRGGRCEAWKTGKFNSNGVYYYDVNSLYPYAISIMKTPDMRTERKHTREDPMFKEKWEKTYSKMIGLSRVMMTNETNEIGILQVRTAKDNFYPIPGQTFIGTYTNEEIMLAVKEGYKLHDVEWCVTYEEAPNPFKYIMEGTYIIRKKSKTDFDNWFYKMMMNTGIGKMAQHRNGQIIKVDDLEDTEEYLSKNYEIIQHHEFKNFFRKDLKDAPVKPYYIPIIPTLCNAKGRLIMYEIYKKVGYENLIYTDTDSVICTKKMDEVLEIGDKLGQLSKEEIKDSINIRGRKTYRIDNKMKVAGVGRSRNTAEEFDKGSISGLQQVTVNTYKNIDEFGTFKEDVRDLDLIEENFHNRKEMLQEEEILVDNDIDDITFFLERLKDVIV